MSEDEKNAVALRKEPLIAGAPVRAIVPQTMEEAWRIAEAICKADMAPKDMKTPARCLVAIMQGLEVGMTPMQSMQRIAVVNGRPVIWGDAAIGLVRASGRCEYVKEWFEGSGDDFVAHCEVKRRGEPQPIVSSFSVHDAKVANLWGKSGPWQQYPKRMLQMRARGFALRDVFADVLGGMYLAEEMSGHEMKDVTPPPEPALTPPEPPGPPTVGAPVVRAPTEGKAARGAPRGSRKARSEKPYVELAASDPLPLSNDEADKYLADLDQRVMAAPSEDDVIAIAQEFTDLFEARLFPPDRVKAEKIFTLGYERFATEE